MPEDVFEKDFGYLMPFLDKIAGAAGSLQDAAAREELIRLVAGEKERWARIRQLLSGASTPQAKPLSPVEIPNLKSQGSDRKPEEKAPCVPTFTIGSLRPPGED